MSSKSSLQCILPYYTTLLLNCIVTIPKHVPLFALVRQRQMGEMRGNRFCWPTPSCSFDLSVERQFVPRNYCKAQLLPTSSSRILDSWAWAIMWLKKSDYSSLIITESGFSNVTGVTLVKSLFIADLVPRRVQQPTYNIPKRLLMQFSGFNLKSPF